SDLTYNLAGEVLSKQFANQDTLTFSYDEFGRKTKVYENGSLATQYFFDTYPSSVPINNTQFGQNRLTRVIHGAGTEVFGYNALGQTIEQSVSLSGLSTKKAQWSFDHLGTLLDMSYQAGASDALSLSYDYDDAMRLRQVSKSGANFVSWAYDDLDRLTTKTLMPKLIPPLQVTDYSYDAWNRLSSINSPYSVSASVGGDTIGMEFGYDNSIGNVSTRKDATPSWIHQKTIGHEMKAQTFRYNPRDFLASVNLYTNSGTSWTSQGTLMNAVYNQVGSIRQMYQNNGANDPYTNYYYDNQRRLNTISGRQAATFSYDASGNLVYDSRWGNNAQIDYSPSQRITRIHSATKELRFDYNHDGQRVRTQHYVVNGNNVSPEKILFTVVMGGTPIAEYKNSVLQKHILGNTAINIPSGSDLGRQGMTYFIHDHLGSPRVAIHESRDILKTSGYYPFGEEIAEETFDSQQLKISQSFTGYERHDELPTALDYANQRYYDPTLGLFLRPDPLAQANPALSAYAYANNNPVAVTDPTGLFPCPPFCALKATVEAFKQVGKNVSSYMWERAPARVGLETTVETYFMPADTRQLEIAPDNAGKLRLYYASPSLNNDETGALADLFLVGGKKGQKRLNSLLPTQVKQTLTVVSSKELRQTVNLIKHGQRYPEQDTFMGIGEYIGDRTLINLQDYGIHLGGGDRLSRTPNIINPSTTQQTKLNPSASATSYLSIFPKDALPSAGMKTNDSILPNGPGFQKLFQVYGDGSEIFQQQRWTVPDNYPEFNSGRQ
ncbi:MAG: RHS repeat-associated core domain-containing protein, partial [Bdellovibrionales bacterium]|nr:RHS repeat-associated core domain-containing protein [Bdellovibrionales bacterium]